MLQRSIAYYTYVSPALQPAFPETMMKRFVIAVSALLAIATQALVVGTVVTNI